MVIKNGNVGIGTATPINKLQVVNGNVRIGEINPLNTGTFPNYGRLLYFSGGPAGGTWDSENSDSLWIARYNVGSDKTELRVNIGDNAQPEDAFVVGSYTAGYNLFRVQTDGNVGIGTANPLEKLHIIPNASGIGVSVRGASPNGVLYQLCYNGAPSCTYVGSNNNGDLFLGKDYTNKDDFVVTNSGNVGIGTTTPAGKFHVKNDVVGSDSSFIILNNGNVGIGTPSPVAKLDIRTTTGIAINPNGIAGGNRTWMVDGIKIGAVTDNAYFGLKDEDPNKADAVIAWGDDAGDDLRFIFALSGGPPDGTEYMRILGSNGNVGIGTTSPTYQLQLSLDQGAKPSTNTWTVVSDERLKNITGRYQKRLKEILQLNPITYYYKNNKDSLFDPRVLKKENIGFTAQDVAKIFPEAVDTTSNGYLGLNIHPILITYVNAIKELKAENDALKEKMNKKNAEIEALKEKMNKYSEQIQTLNKEMAEIKAMLGMKTEK